MPHALFWDQHQFAVRLPGTTAAPERQTWQIGDAGRVFTVHGSHAFPRYPMYDVYETTGDAPVTPTARIAQVHSLMRARLMIARLARPAFTADWTAWETALVIGEGLDLATAAVTERGTWTFALRLRARHRAGRLRVHRRGNAAARRVLGRHRLLRRSRGYRPRRPRDRTPRRRPRRLRPPVIPIPPGVLL